MKQPDWMNEQGLGKRQQEALAFARHNPGWQSFDRGVRAVLRSLSARGLVLVSDVSQQFRAVLPAVCDQCRWAWVNGMFCHETGCPNQKKTWVAERGEWVRFVECRECGCEVETGTVCDCQTEGDAQ